MRPLRFVHPYFLFAALFIPSNVPAGEACREFPKPFPGTLRAPVSYNLYECIRFQRPFPFNLKRTPAPATFFFFSYNRNTVRLVNLCTTEKIGEAVACFKIFKRQGRSRTRYSKKKRKRKAFKSIPYNFTNTKPHRPGNRCARFCSIFRFPCSIWFQQIRHGSQLSFFAHVLGLQIKTMT